MAMHAVHLVGLLALLAAPSSASCSRATLQAASDGFFKSAVAKDKAALNLAANVKITQDNKPLAALSESAWANITGFLKPFRLSAIDTDACTIATFAAPTERGPKGDAPALLSIRLKLAAPAPGAEADAPTAIEELELLNARAESIGLFQPAQLPEQVPALWTRVAAGSGARTTRGELLRIADTYPSSIEAGNGGMMAVSGTCSRVENGVTMATAGRCSAMIEMLRFPVRHRRWVVDVTTGVVMGHFLFDQKKKMGRANLQMHEYFAIREGRIQGVYAVMIQAPDAFKDAWGV